MSLALPLACSWKKWDNALDGILVLALNLPALVVIILCHLWFGLGEFAAILAVTINKFPVELVTIAPRARAVGTGSPMQVATAFLLLMAETSIRVYLPQLYPLFITVSGIRPGSGVEIVLVVELLGRSSGVGFKLGIYFQFFQHQNFAYNFWILFCVMR